MKRYCILIFGFIIMSANFLFGQNEEYKVYFHSGNVWMKVKGEIKNIVRDAPIVKNTVLIVDENACVVLVNQASVPMAISKPGEYNLKKITTQYGQMKVSNVTEEFFRYMVANLSGTDDKKHVSGGVYKGIDLDFFLKKTPENGALILDSIFILSWQNADFDSAFVKLATSPDDTIPIVLPVYGDSLEINILQTGLIPGTRYYWAVEPRPGRIADQFDINDFTIAPKDFVEEFGKSVANIVETSPSSEMRKLALMRLYWDNKIYPLPDFTKF